MLDDWTIWAALVAIIDVALAMCVTIHAVLWKRDSRSVIAWVGLAWLAPLFGVCAYICLGINRIERKAVSLDLVDAKASIREQELGPEDLKQLDTFVDQHPELVGLGMVGRRLTGLPVVPGNKVDPLIDGDEAFPAMLEAIAGAKKSVSLLSYIFDSDRAGEAFLDELVKAQQRGVEVRVLIDDVGSRYSRTNMVKRLKDAGINSASFLPTRIPRLPTYANLRNHRKILVADGQIAFTGGTNIRAAHCLQWDSDFPVQCLHFRLEGPVAAHLQHAFAADWAFATQEVLSGETWFPAIDRRGKVWARGIEHGPDQHFEKMADTIFAALAIARHQVRIVTPYFLPNSSLIQALNVAAMRGVNVEIYLPSENNIALVHWAATAQFWQMLEKGCQIFYTPPPFDHSKLMVVDGIWSLIGSTNWDPRSLRLNFEFNVECYDTELAKRLNQIVDAKAKDATPVTLDDVNNRGFAERLRDGLARLLKPYL